MSSPAGGLPPTVAPRPRLARLLAAADLTALVLASGALTVLALRAALRLEDRWDTFWYHVPFAAIRGGLGIPFEMSPGLQDRFQGFPPLAHAVQGILWRLTGSMNATGVANYIALALFLYFCHRKLKVPFHIVALVSLTAPLVLIHAASTYVDLFSNALLAIGTTALAAMFIRDRFDDRGLLLWALGALVAAAWTKYHAVGVVAAALGCLVLVYGRNWRDPARRKLLYLCLAAGALSLAWYARNFVLYGNPIWPLGMGAMGSSFPRAEQVSWGSGEMTQRPPELSHLNQLQLYLHSLLEINHPTSYDYRQRWILDQGSGWVAFRMGGFWNVAVITGAAAATLLGLLHNLKKGLGILAGIGGMYLITSFLPHAQQLRYYQFLPLTIAGIIAILIPLVRSRYPAVVLAVLVVLLGEFAYVSNVNRFYYRIERRGYGEVAASTPALSWWSRLEQGRSYCAVGFAPMAIVLTGPTMSEFRIIERRAASQCPTGIPVIVGPRAPVRAEPGAGG